VFVALSALEERPRPPRLGSGTRRAYDAVRETLERLGPGASAATVVEDVRRRLLELA
jgi:hypothetical protein